LRRKRKMKCGIVGWCAVMFAFTHIFAFVIALFVGRYIGEEGMKATWDEYCKHGCKARRR
jgi:hypothetical protein